MKTETTTYHCDVCKADKTIMENGLYIPGTWSTFQAAVDGYGKGIHLCTEHTKMVIDLIENLQAVQAEQS